MDWRKRQGLVVICFSVLLAAEILHGGDAARPIATPVLPFHFPALGAFGLAKWSSTAPVTLPIVGGNCTVVDVLINFHFEV